MGEEVFGERHKDLTAFGEQGVDAFGFGGAFEGEREIGAAHGLEVLGRYVVGEQLGVAEVHAGVDDRLFEFGRDLIERGRVRV